MKSRLLRLASCLSLVAAFGAAVPGGPTLAAHRPYRPSVPFGETQTASGQISMVLGSSQFVLSLADGNALAVNLAANTMVTDEIASAGSGASGGATTATTTPTATLSSGEYAVVRYRFTPAAGAVAVAVTLSTAPVATGKPHRVNGLVTDVGSGSFVLEGPGGASWTITLLPTTRIYTQGVATSGTLAIAVGDFATAIVRSGSGINDAVSVTYGSRPYGSRVQGMSGTVTGVSGQQLSLALPNGARRTVSVLPSATVTLNGQASTLAALASGDAARVLGSMFQSTFYAYEIRANSAANG